MTDFLEKQDDYAETHRKLLSEWQETIEGYKQGVCTALEVENSWQRYRLFNKQLEDNLIERAEP